MNAEAILMNNDHEEIKKVFLKIPGYEHRHSYASISGNHLFHFKASQEALIQVAKVAAWSNSRLTLYLDGNDTEIVYLLDFNSSRFFGEFA
jgi:hypothetical protein